ncbi:MAG: SUMF1/EgtB/PvdO family nonheme iron enzyme [Anaerolineae bacterium]|nr:SUMF1/EgtB/PvdO family nonheme iron enzyme [Anaerolineae bacterium]
MSLSEGKILDNRYRVLRPLGEGGMGTAYLVEDQRLGRRCVAKASALHDTAFREQFEQEARMLAALNHQNLPEVYDYFFDRGSPYLIMQYVEGATLDRLKVDRAVPFEADQVLRWANDLLDALIYLHGQDPPIVHRDIKPSNVCITPEGKAVLLDFGIARRLDQTSTQTGARLHSTHYAPIEQYPAEVTASYDTLRQYLEELKALGIHTGPYSDVYGLGATLYFALTLFDPPDACWRKIEEGLRPVREVNPDVPEFLAEALEQALVVDPRQRCQTAAQFKQMLQPEPVEVPVRALRPRRPRPLPTGNVAALDHELVYIPAGTFLMGSDDGALKEACRPQHAVELGAYCIARRPITHADYQVFLDNVPDHPVPHSPMRFAQRYNWDRRSRTYPRGLEDHPVVLVAWADALAYCRWLGEVTGYRCRLPTEAEWEKAACWDPEAGHVRRYPWGDEFDEARCNVDAHGALRLEPSPVGRYSPGVHPELVEGGDSAYGLADMAGNVWEWTGSLYRPYPYDAADGREALGADGERVVRGGAYDEGPLPARSAWRNGVKPDLRAANVGFRVVCDAG